MFIIGLVVGYFIFGHVVFNLFQKVGGAVGG